eukprot:4652745-Prymnesium_polylepis.1
MQQRRHLEPRPRERASVEQELTRRPRALVRRLRQRQQRAQRLDRLLSLGDQRVRLVTGRLRRRRVLR